MKLHLSELHYNLGHVLHQQGSLVEAMAAYREALRLDRSFARAHHGLAIGLAAQGQVEAAIWHYYQAIALQPDSANAENNLGCLFIEQGRFSEAIQLYRQAIDRHPDQAILHSNFGKAIESTDPAAACLSYRRAIQLQPNFVTAHYNLGQLLLLQGQYQAAITAFQALLQIDPDYFSAQAACGYAYRALHQFDQALLSFRKALEPSRAFVFAFCEWADTLNSDDELSQARRACSQLLRLFMQSSPDRWIVEHQQILQQQLAHTHACFGDLLLRYGGENQLQQAEFHYQQALQLQPDRWEWYGQLGRCLAQQKRWNAAITVHHLAITLNPDQGLLYQQLGYLLEQQQRWSEAIFYYRQAMQLIGKSSRLSDRLAYTSDRSVHLPATSPDPVERTIQDSLPFASAAFAAPPINLRGIYAQTRDWITAHQSGQWIALQVNDEWQLQLDSADRSNISPSPPLAVDLSPSCDGLNCMPCLQKLTQQFWPIHLGQGVYRLSGHHDTSQSTHRSTHQLLDQASIPSSSTGFSPSLSSASSILSLSSPSSPFTSSSTPDYFVAQLPHAQAWMTPYQSDWMVTNSVTILTADHYLLADVSREYPGQLPNCTRSHSTYHRLIDRAHGAKPEAITGNIAVLAGLSGHNYFHWMVDVLPRLELLRQSGIQFAEIDRFWINEVRSPFQQATLDHLGIPAAKWLSADRHPAITADRLTVPSFPSHLGWAEAWVLNFLRQQFLPIASSHPCHERIYISRNQANHRRLLNEAAVIERLQSIGFVVVEPEHLSFSEQIALFSQAKVIVAPHGGGLTNLIFASPGTIVIEFMTRSYMRHYYWQISQQLQLQHFVAIGEPFTCPPIYALMYPSPLMEDIWLDLATLEKVLAQADLL